MSVLALALALLLARFEMRDARSGERARQPLLRHAVCAAAAAAAACVPPAACLPHSAPSCCPYAQRRTATCTAAAAGEALYSQGAGQAVASIGSPRLRTTRALAPTLAPTTHPPARALPTPAPIRDLFYWGDPNVRIPQAGFVPVCGTADPSNVALGVPGAVVFRWRGAVEGPQGVCLITGPDPSQCPGGRAGGLMGGCGCCGCSGGATCAAAAVRPSARRPGANTNPCPTCLPAPSPCASRAHRADVRDARRGVGRQPRRHAVAQHQRASLGRDLLGHQPGAGRLPVGRQAPNRGRAARGQRREQATRQRPLDGGGGGGCSGGGCPAHMTQPRFVYSRCHRAVNIIGGW